MDNQSNKIAFGIFGNVALETYKLIIDGELDYKLAWNITIVKHTNSKETQIKNCPKNIFLDLCYDGYLKNISPNKHFALSKNIKYAKESIEKLNMGKVNYTNPLELWKNLKSTHDISTNVTISYNQQMHVVMALWNDKLIRVK